MAAQKGIPSYVLDDLSSRFIINCRPETIKSVIRIFFQIETAYWFYLDFHRAENSELMTCSLKTFANMLMKHCSMLQKYVPDFDKHFESWKVYKRSIATYGAIILDESLKHVILVQSYSTKKSWGFPKGKINYNESPVDCATREVLEETGFDINPYVDPEEFFEKSCDEQVNRLYIIAGVPLNTTFQPKTRREIRDIQWFPLDTVLTPKGDPSLKGVVGQNPYFYLVAPFIREVRKWINNRGKGRQKKLKLGAGKSKVDKSQSVRYSRDMALEEKLIKQSRRGMTVGESLFGSGTGNRESLQKTETETELPDYRQEFVSEAWSTFHLNVEAIIRLLPIENPSFTITSYQSTSQK